MKTTESGQEKIGGEINYLVIISISVIIVLYGIANKFTPQVDSELDFFELTSAMAPAAVSVLSFIVAKRYWQTRVFGRAYLALAIGYAAYFMGNVLWYISQIAYGVANPYPSWPDIGFSLFLPFAIYHLTCNVHFFKRKFDTREKYWLVLAPTIVTVTYILLLLLSSGFDLDSESSQQIIDQLFWSGLIMGSIQVGASTVVFSYSLIGFRIFRKSLLGAPWGLLLVGLTLNWAGDFAFYYSSIFSYDRTSPIIVAWVASQMILCYALYKHREL
jgi:hypothetical protein